MPTSGDLEVDYRKYGSEYKNETASPGYYSNLLTKYNIKTEVSATPRVGIARFTFPKGQANILLKECEILENTRTNPSTDLSTLHAQVNLLATQVLTLTLALKELNNAPN